VIESPLVFFLLQAVYHISCGYPGRPLPAVDIGTGVVVQYSKRDFVSSALTRSTGQLFRVQYIHVQCNPESYICRYFLTLPHAGAFRTTIYTVFILYACTNTRRAIKAYTPF
jgi:hypothetical protein